MRHEGKRIQTHFLNVFQNVRESNSSLKVGCHDTPFFFQLKCLQQFLQPQRSSLGEGSIKASHQNNTHNSQAIEQQKLISNSVI